MFRYSACSFWSYAGRKLFEEWCISGDSAFGVWGCNHASFLMSFISSGSGLNGVDILFCLGCFINTLSPTVRSVLLARLQLFAYSFISSFLLASVCLTSGGAWSCCNRGNVDLSFRPFKNLEGDVPVVLWGWTVLASSSCLLWRLSQLPSISLPSKENVKAWNHCFADVDLRISTSEYQSRLTSCLHFEKDHRSPWIALGTGPVVEGTFVEA